MSGNFYRDTYTAKLSPKARQMLFYMYVDDEPWSGARVAAFLDIYEQPGRVRVFMSKIRRALKGTGWTISTNKGGTHAFGTYEVQRG